MVYIFVPLKWKWMLSENFIKLKFFVRRDFLSALIICQYIFSLPDEKYVTFYQQSFYQ